MRQPGFTLIEIMVVLLILSLIAGAVVLRVQTPLKHAQTQDVTDALAAFDHASRDAAREQDRQFRLVITPATGRLSLADDRGQPVPSVALTLPDSFRLERLWVRNQDIGRREVALSISRNGSSPSYAMELSGGAGRRWLIVAGLTGQVIQVEHEDEAQYILAATGEGIHPR